MSPKYESIIDPDETWPGKWVMHELCEVYNYYSCLQTEGDPRIKALWAQFLDYELGHFHAVCELYKTVERKDPAAFLPKKLPRHLPYTPQRAFVRKVLAGEVDFRAVGKDIGPLPDSPASLKYRDEVNKDGSPSERVALGYRYTPGTELSGRSNGSKSAGGREARS